MTDRSLLLDQETCDRIAELCELGDGYLEEAQTERALKAFREALALLPDPNNGWTWSAWIYSALTDVYEAQNNNEMARKMARVALSCPGGLGNPLLHFNVGKFEFALGNRFWAAEHFLIAFDAGGHEVFKDEDPEYFEFLQSKFNLENMTAIAEQKRSFYRALQERVEVEGISAMQRISDIDE